MATGILMPGATVANPVDVIPPVVPNLVLWTYFGTDLAHCVNAGTGGALVPGLGATLTYSPHYISAHGFQGSLGMAAFTPSTSQTWMGVVRYTGGGTGGASGALITPPSGSSGPIIGMTASTMTLQCNGVTPATALTIAASGGNNFKFYAFVGIPGGAHTFYNLTDNTSQLIQAVGTMALTANVTYGIGGPTGGASANDRGTDHAFQAWAMTVLTKPQIDAQYAAVKNVVAQYGIVV